MLDQLKRNILTTKELMGMPDEKALLKALHLKELIPIEDGEKEELKKKHSDYVTRISSPEMAVSFESSEFLYKLMRSLKPKNASDIGAGFSSYVMRQAVLKNGSGTIYSVDDDAKWLEKTRSYLKENSTGTDHLYDLKEFQHQQLPEFNIVLLDLNFVEVRKNYIDAAIQLTSKNGIIIFDDTHKIEYLREVKEKCEKLGVQLFDCRSSTLDRFKRFALIGIK